MTTTAPYGSWKSPLSAAAVAAGSPRLDGAAFVGDDVWWGESVVAEGGRAAVFARTPDGETRTVLAGPWSARSSVHEYGGGSWTASPDGVLFFVEKTDQRVWRLGPTDNAPVPLTPDTGGRVRHGGLTWQHGSLLAIREAHGATAVPARSIVRLPLEPGTGAETLADGSDFVAQPALSADGTRLTWVAWDHPNMPWDQTRILVRDLRTAAPAEQVTSATTAALQPVWAGDDLLLIDEPTGRWNLWRAHRDASDGDQRAWQLTAVSPADADTGGGLWVLGTRWFAPLSNGAIIAIRTQGSDSVVRIEPDGSVGAVDVPVTDRASIDASDGTRVLISGNGPQGPGIWMVDGDAVTPVRTATNQLDPAWRPTARSVTYPGPHGPVHAFDYPPTNPTHVAPEGTLPPYVVMVHGGPTAHVGGTADAKTAYFTSRGVGVLDVNYGGSTGYGRQYRERLRGQWGIVDVDDVVAAARGLVAEGAADPNALAIEGGSAGGWTVLGALVSPDARGTFAAGISRYGVGDARMLAQDTHDFEARYLDGLIGPLPEAEALYIERSPLTHADRFSVPTLLLQGDEDAVVPPSQAEAIRDALRARGIPHAYVLFEGEGHGFRRAETIIDALETELAFLGQVFGFTPAGISPISLD